MKVILFALLPALAWAAEPVLRQGRFHTPEAAAAEWDARWQEYPTREAWDQRAAAIRTGILAGAELSPPSERKLPTAIRHSPQVRDGYTVENVSLEAAPGFYVAGNLYLPADRAKMPVVLSSHGHWSGEPLAHGRFQEPMQKRCGALARMGCAVFAWDMVGHGESALAGWKHGVDGSELRLQLWNAIRVLDYMLALPGVDPTRVAVTGESGGATQAIQLAAVDPRVTASIPCVQISSWFYGGCACESGLPIHVRPGHVANNAEIAASIAPKPLLILSDGKDWTQHVPTIEFPRMQRIYALYGKESAIQNEHFADEGHDYGPSKRAALYRFVAETFSLDASLADEEKITVLPAASLRAFDEAHPRPDDEVPLNSPVKLYDAGGGD